MSSLPMKTKSNSDIITAFSTMIAYFKQFGYDIHTLHSNHENSLISAMVFHTDNSRLLYLVDTSTANMMAWY